VQRAFATENTDPEGMPLAEKEDKTENNTKCMRVVAVVKEDSFL
jgi:hypothetical protein